MAITPFDEFDPLSFKSLSTSEAATNAVKREIKNILSSYVGWYDPFCELIQNALDSVEARAIEEKRTKSGEGYKPRIGITVNMQANCLTVTDNGVGLNKDQFQQFLAPNFSFKSGNTRGHKGVGATYVAYGFNKMQVATKTVGFETVGQIIRARTWLDDPAPSGNPKVILDASGPVDLVFNDIDRGVSITVFFDEFTHPKRLDWVQASTADSWWKILSIKTGLGAVFPNSEIRIELTVIAPGGTSTSLEKNGVEYYWIYRDYPKTARFREIKKTEKELFEKRGAGFRHPDKISNLDLIYEQWCSDELEGLLGKSLNEEERIILRDYRPTVGVEFGYTAKLWQKFNEDLGVRSNYRVMTTGIQMAANNMPQGEPIQIPLTRNIGRQNQIHFLIHFENYTPDLGRKGFHRELSDFAKGVARQITENHLSQVRARLKVNTGVAPDLLREQQISEWKKDMLSHEQSSPLRIMNDNFFFPVQRVSITSTPTREQDVIALFHQLIAGGIVRGIQVMATNERLTYDSLFKIAFDLAPEKYIFNKQTNPLGISEDVANQLKGLVTEPKVLEYKFSLDGLIEDVESGDKNIKDINLTVVWSSGNQYRERYGINSLLLSENQDQRSFHGATHVLSDLESGAKIMDLIILEELIDYLNDQVGCEDKQRVKYE